MLKNKKKILIVIVSLLLLAMASAAGYRYVLSRSDYYINKVSQLVKARLSNEATFQNIRINKNRLVIENIALSGKLNIIISHIEIVLRINPFQSGLGMPQDILIGKVHGRIKEKDLPDVMRLMQKMTGSSMRDASTVKKGENLLRSLASLRHIRSVKMDQADFIILNDGNQEVGSLRNLTAEGDLQKFHFSTGKFLYKDYVAFDRIKGQIIANDDIPRNSIPFLITLESKSQPVTIQGDIAKDLSTVKIATKVKKIDFIAEQSNLPLVLNDQSDFSISAKISNILNPKDINMVVNVIAHEVGAYHPNLASTPVVLKKIRVFSQSRFDRSLADIKSTVKISIGADEQDQDEDSFADARNPSKGVSFNVEFSKNHVQTAKGEQQFYAIDLKMDQTPCQQIKDSLPSAITSQLEGFELIGSAKFGFQSSWTDDKIDEFDFQIREAAFNCKVIKSPEEYSVARLNSRAPLEDRVRRSMDGAEKLEVSPHFIKNYIPFGQISPKFVAAVIASEDAGFYYHKGFQFQSIVNAMRRNLKEKSVVLGGSTITMQMVKNLFLSRDRTISRKIQEVFLAWYIDSILTKEKIFEIYANIIEYGPDLYGIDKAARHFFGKHPVSLTALESAYIATLLPNPKGRYLYFCRNKISDNFRVLLNKNLQRMSDLNLITSDELQTALTTKLAFSKFRFVAHDPGCKQNIAAEEDPATMSESFRIDF